MHDVKVQQVFTTEVSDPAIVREERHFPLLRDDDTVRVAGTERWRKLRLGGNFVGRQGDDIQPSLID